jgi:threonine dehydrogenase-like Zn-dependent dehydrogenase
VSDPQLLELGSVVLKVKVCSICGTALRTYHYGNARIKLPHILGREIDGNREALDMLARGLLRIDDLVSHRFPLDSIREAFLFAESRNGMHTAIIPNDDQERCVENPVSAYGGHSLWMH